MGTVIFGLDGADPELIERWIDDLPNFRRLKEKGFFGRFRSTEPPITVPAWMCIFSGRSPSDFDAYDFRTIDFEEFYIQVVNSTHFRGRTLLDSVERPISFRVPGSTPKYPIEGPMVSGFIQGEMMDYEPESLGEEIASEVDPDIQEMSGGRRDKKEIASNNFSENFEVFSYLLDEKEFSTAFSVFRLIDTHMHNVDDQEELFSVYRKADKFLGKLLDRFSDEHNVVVLSDHGSMQTEKKLYLNNVLREKGFLRYGEEESSPLRKVEEKVGSLLVNLGLKQEVKKLLDIYSSFTGKDPQHTQSTILPALDREKTEAFCYISGVSRYGAVWINDCRFDQGAVEDSEAKAEEVKTSLKDVKYIEEVWGPESFRENRKMPDLLVKAEKGTVIGGEPYNVDFHRTSAVVHDEHGLLAGIGPDFSQGETLEASYRDIAPTLQALEGEVDIDRGEVLEHLLRDDYSFDEDLLDVDI
ncbi:MAG: alkaline phosphatase family protein [Candidatus Nanohalobium sp.]